MRQPNKKCIRCGIYKPLGDFHRCKKSPDGYRSYCKDCISMMMTKDNSIISLEGEEWKDVKGFKGVYFISNYGRIKHVINKHRQTLRVPYPAPNGYLRLVLSYKNKRKTVSVHRLVAEAFIPNPYGLDTVNHKDLDKTNNKVSNLEWLSCKSNIIHAKDNGKNNRKPIYQCDKDENIIREWESAWAVQLELGYFSTLISRCCRGKMNTYKGYKWRFKK